MGKALDIGKNLFNMVKGKGLEKDREEWGDNFVGDDSVKGHFNIGTFNAKLTDLNSLYRPNRYLVRFKRAPKCLVDASTATHAASDIMFFCDNVNIPGASIIPVDHKRFGIGPFDRRASNIIPAEISASFMLDGMGKNLDFLQQWVAGIVYMGDESGAVNLTVGESRRAGSSEYHGFGELSYRDDYTTEMQIETYDSIGNKINTLTAHEVWPSQLGDVTLGWAQNDEVGRVTVNFQLQRWTTKNYAAKIEESNSKVSDRVLSPMERLLRIGSAARSLKASWKNPDSVGDVVNIFSNAQTFLGSFGGKKG